MNQKNIMAFLSNFLSGTRLYNLVLPFISSLSSQSAKLKKVIFATLITVILSGAFIPDAVALTQIKLFDLSYKDCPPELAQGSVISSGSAPANCFIVTGKAQNPTYKTVYDADIFGRIFDANNNSVMQNRSRLGSIPEVPPGVSNFELRISVAANLPVPLKLKQFKATGFSGKVRR